MITLQNKTFQSKYTRMNLSINKFVKDSRETTNQKWSLACSEILWKVHKKPIRTYKTIWRMNMEAQGRFKLWAIIPKSKFKFRIGNEGLQYVNQYQYLDVIFHEKIDLKTTADVLCKSGGRALGTMISKIHKKMLHLIPIKTILFIFHVIPIFGYCPGDREFKTYHS